MSVTKYLGQNVDAAKSELEALGLTVILQEQATDRESENGTVLSQSLESGTKISAGAKITLTYGKYTAPSNIDVSQYLSDGMSLVDAVSSLNSAGISYSISGMNSGDDMSLYTVKGFTKKIKQGETVKIQVEKTQITEPTEPTEDDTDTTTPGDGDSTNVNAGADSGSDNPNPTSGN